MAKIETLDYDQMGRQAKNMRSEGRELNTIITSTYNEVREMRSSWYGKKYDSLVTEFNKAIPSLNEMLTLVVHDFPVTLEKIANTYSQADQGINITTVNEQNPKKVEEIQKTNKDNQMRFIQENVSTVQSNVKSNFEKATNKMNQIESTFKRITWTSEAATAFQNKFSSLKSKINQSFENIKKGFDDLMGQALKQIQEAEKSNTIS